MPVLNYKQQNQQNSNHYSLIKILASAERLSVLTRFFVLPSRCNTLISDALSDKTVELRWESNLGRESQSPIRTLYSTTDTIFSCGS